MDDNERICAYKIISIFAGSNELNLDDSKFDFENQLDFFNEETQKENPQKNMTSFEG